MSLRSRDNGQAKYTSTCSDLCTHVGPPLSLNRMLQRAACSSPPPAGPIAIARYTVSNQLYLLCNNYVFAEL